MLVTLVMYIGGGLGMVSLPAIVDLFDSTSCCKPVKRFIIVVGLSQYSLDLTCLGFLVISS
jgi:hypothetical protein